MCRYLLILLLWFPFSAFSQKVLFETTQVGNMTVLYTRYANEEEKINNLILEQLAGEKVDYNLSFSINYNEYAALIKEKGTLKVIYRLSDFTFKGNTLKRGLDVSRYLLPELVKCRITLFNSKQAKLSSFEMDTCCLTHPKDIHQWQWIIPSSDSTQIANALYLSIENSKLKYAVKGVERLKDFSLIIDQYYNSESALKEIDDILKTIKTENIDMIPLYRIDLNRVDKIINTLESLPFYSSLDLSVSDPISFKERFKTLKNSYSLKATVVNHLMSSIDEVYYNKGYTFFLKNNYEKASAYFERSIRANPLYVRSHYKLAEVSFISGQIDKAAGILKHVINDLKIEQDLESDVLALTQQVMLEYADRGEQKIRAEDFHNALKEFEKASAFCTEIDKIECIPAIELGFEKARGGLYASYLTIAAKAVENNKPDLAAKFIYDAITYLKAQSNLNIDPLQTDTVAYKIIDMLIQQGRSQYDKALYEEAVGAYNKAMMLCRVCTDTACILSINGEIKLAKTALYENILVIVRAHIDKGELDRAEYLLHEAEMFQKDNKVTSYAIFETENLWLMVNKLKYRNNIYRGLELVNAGFSDEALAFFMKAKEIEKDKIAFPDAFLNDYIRNAAKPNMLKMLSNAKIKVWGNDLSQAKEMRDTLHRQLKYYLLETDSFLSISFDELTSRIAEQECTNLGFEIEKQFLAAKRMRASADYTSAFNILTTILDSVHQKPQCQTDTFKIVSLLNEIKPSHIRQSGRKQIFDAFGLSQFTVADSLMNIYNVSSSSDEAPVCTYNDVFQSVFDTRLLHNAALYYANPKTADEALLILKRIRDLNENPTKYTQVQKKIALLMAQRDFESNRNSQPEAAFRNYGVNNAWFNVLKTHYKRRWKYLKMSGVFRKK